MTMIRLLLEGPLEGKVSRGRPRTEWMTNIPEWTGMRYEDLVVLAQDREQRKVITSSRRRHLHDDDDDDTIAGILSGSGGTH